MNITNDYETRTTRLTVTKKGAPIFDASSTTIEIDDEGGGEYLVISQNPDSGEQRIKIDPAEWPAIREAIDRMIVECRA